MMRLRRIGPVSAARFGFWLGFATMFAQILVALFFLTINGVPPTSLPLDVWRQIAWLIFMSSAITAFSTFVFAMIYNWSTDMFGGLELEFEMLPPSVEKTADDFEIED
jgi:hypothetical protein